MTEPNEEIVFKKPSVGLKDGSVADNADEGSADSSAPPEVDEPLKPQVVSKTIIPEPMTKLMPPNGHFFIDQLKNGVLVEHKMIAKPRVVFGRATDCDVVLEHPSISRYHAVLLWSPVSDEEFASGKNTNSFWYLVDCGSTHGTTCNKSPIAAGKVIKLIPNNNVFKFGASTRLFSLGSTLEESDEEEDSISDKSEETLSKKPGKEAEEDNGCTWGIDDDEDEAEEAGEETADSKSLQAIIAALKSGSGSGNVATENSNAYSQNPTKCIQQWFEREGYDIDYKCDSLHNKFKCTIDLPVDGQWIPVEGALTHKKKEAIADTCLKCCQLLDKAELLFPWQQKRAATRRRLEDDPDSDTDMIDETVELSKKARKDKDGDSVTEVDDFESLNKKWSEINEQLRQLRVKMANIGAQDQRDDHENPSDGDPLDSYMASVGHKRYGLSMSDKIEKSKTRMKINALEKEQQRLERLIQLAKPSLPSDVFDNRETTPTDDKPKVETEVKLISQTITSNTSSVKTSGDQKRDQSCEELKDKERKEEIRRKTEQIVNELKSSAKARSESKPPKQSLKAQQSVVEAIEREKKAEKGRQAKQCSQYDSDFVDWLPPSGQTGDGKTALNQKLGY